MSTFEDQTNVRAASPSSSAASSSDDEEAVGSAREEDRQADTLRTVQVVSAPPREGTSDEGETEGASSSSSEAEEDAKEENGPSRGKSYLQSIRARKPKKKVYAKPKSKSKR